MDVTTLHLLPCEDVTYQPTTEEVDKYCEAYTVIPEWQKFEVEIETSTWIEDQEKSLAV